MILAPVVGNKDDEEVIRLACSLSRKNRAEICNVYVIAVKRALLLDAEIESEITKAEGIFDFVDEYGASDIVRVLKANAMLSSLQHLEIELPQPFRQRTRPAVTNYSSVYFHERKYTASGAGKESFVSVV